MIAAPPEPAGKIWSAWSPQSLHPWAPPRLDRQTALVPSSFWLDHHILPLRVERVDGRQALVVAAASADVDPAVLLQLRSLVRLPVRVAPAAADDVEFWLDVLFRGETWRDAVGRSLLETLELGRRSSTPLGGDVGVGDITAAFGLPEDMAVEVLALRARLPQVRLEKCAIPCGLVGPLIARWTVEELQVVPAVLRRGFLLLASPRVQQPETMIRLAREIGFEPRLALCTPSAFQAALRLLPAGSTPAPPPPAERDLLDALLRRSIINASQHDGLLTLARLTLETPVEAASRLGYLTPEQLTGVTANLAGVLFVADAAVAANATLSAYGSQDLWRRWSCVPLQLAGQGATLGATRLLTEDVLLAANQLTGTNFQQALITDAALDQALSAVAPHRSASFAPEHYLLDAGLAQTTAELLETANHLARDESVTLAEAFH
ncbi:MAG TPA: hypothetical protein VF157_00225, partial [Chloroflexota bacterium]